MTTAVKIENADDRGTITLHQLVGLMHGRLDDKYGRAESEAMIRVIFSHLKGWTPVDLVIRRDETVSGFIAEKAMSIVDKLMKDYPLQYIIGETRFYGNTLVVSPDVLIPRPETEELVDIIVKDNNATDLRVLDLCTGSGCIAVSLARALRFPKVKAVDLSEAALTVARENAARLKVNVDFIRDDVLAMKPVSDSFDIIVSNPPYVLDSERSAMSDNVLCHEPPMALFVPNDDALKFYRPIARQAIVSLSPGGRLYLEINPLKADDMRQLLTGTGFLDVDIVRDMAGKERFALAQKPTRP